MAIQASDQGSGTARFIANLQSLREGDLAILRSLAFRELNETLAGFDLFTALWWGLRERNQWAPPRSVAWLICKLYAAYPINQHNGRTLPRQLATYQVIRFQNEGRERFRQKVNAMLNSPLSDIEPQLRWALRIIQKSVHTSGTDTEEVVERSDNGRSGFDWIELTNDLSNWNQFKTREQWARQFLNISIGG